MCTVLYASDQLCRSAQLNRFNLVDRLMRILKVRWMLRVSNKIIKENVQRYCSIDLINKKFRHVCRLMKTVMENKQMIMMMKRLKVTDLAEDQHKDGPMTLQICAPVHYQRLLYWHGTGRNREKSLASTVQCPHHKGQEFSRSSVAAQLPLHHNFMQLTCRQDKSSSMSLQL